MDTARVDIKPFLQAVHTWLLNMDAEDPDAAAVWSTELFVAGSGMIYDEAFQRHLMTNPNLREGLTTDDVLASMVAFFSTVSEIASRNPSPPER